MPIRLTPSHSPFHPPPRPRHRPQMAPLSTSPSSRLLNTLKPYPLPASSLIRVQNCRRVPPRLHHNDNPPNCRNMCPLRRKTPKTAQRRISQERRGNQHRTRTRPTSHRSNQRRFPLRWIRNGLRYSHQVPSGLTLVIILEGRKGLEAVLARAARGKISRQTTTLIASFASSFAGMTYWHASYPRKRTVDLTLAAFVRAIDVIVQNAWRTRLPQSRVERTWKREVDTIVFAASCTIIMFAWFYTPERLPKFVVWGGGLIVVRIMTGL